LGCSEDLNRKFDGEGDGDGPEERAFYYSISSWQDSVDVALHLHEDHPEISNDFAPSDGHPNSIYGYAWGGAAAHTDAVRLLDRLNRAGFRICEAQALYGDHLRGGVADYTTASTTHGQLRGMGLLDEYLTHAHRVAHCSTIETPGTWAFDRRVNAHMLLIQFASEHLLVVRHEPLALSK
jgi:hypothetical protein